MLTFAIFTLLPVGCAATRRDAVPHALTDKAEVPGYTSKIRYFPRETGDVEALKEGVLDAYAREQASLGRQGYGGTLPPSVLFDDALADNAPLRNLVKKNVTQDILDAIATEHAKGRILLVGTTNLDARRPVIWNLTKITASGRPGALQLFQSLLVASAAIPGTFPPVMIDVEADQKRFRKCTSTAVRWLKCSSIQRPSTSRSCRKSMGYSASESSTSSATQGWIRNGRKWIDAYRRSR